MIIEKDDSSNEIINNHYENKNVLFEHCILESKKYYYSICYCPKKDIYDVILIDNNTSKLINYEARHKLSNSTLKYFNVKKDDIIEDNFGNKLKCLTHFVEVENK